MFKQIYNNAAMVAQEYAKLAKALNTQQNPIKSANSSNNSNSGRLYNSLSAMLEECYFVGSTEFGHNFIA